MDTEFGFSGEMFYLPESVDPNKQVDNDWLGDCKSGIHGVPDYQLRWVVG